MKINVGDYVRTKYGIERIKNIEEWVNFRGYEKIITTDKNRYETLYEQSEIIKSSPNIIDLIEVGDYVNGEKVEGVNNEIKGFGTIIFSKDSSIMEDYIYLIVTKEQFSQMEYRINE